MSRSYDEYDRPQSSGGSGKTLLIVFGIIGAVVLGCAGIVVVCIAAIITLGQNASGTFTFVATKVSSGGSIEGPFRGAASAEAVGKEFFDDLAGGRIDSAYELTTARFRANLDRDAFRQKISGMPALTRRANNSSSRHMAGAAQGTYTYTVNSPGGQTTVELRVVSEGGQWHVDEFTPR
jgi:hypothetical protein